MPNMPTKRLTEDMVIARTKTSDLNSVKKFNCWGSELSDISVIRRFGNVEVLSLSLNNISTLADFQFCGNLVELYVRRNDIRDLSEICYLQDLPRLRRLLLSENPCVETAGHLYRATVIRALPHLEILDTAQVTAEEVEMAMKTGLLLEHPLATNSTGQDRSPEGITYYEQQDSPPPVGNFHRNSAAVSDDEPMMELRRTPPHLEYHYQHESQNGTKSAELTPPSLPKTTSLHNHNNNTLPNNANNGQLIPGGRRDSGISSADSHSTHSNSPPLVGHSAPLGTNPPLLDGTRQSPEDGYPMTGRNGGRRITEYASDYERVQQYYEPEGQRSRGSIPQGSVSGRSETTRSRQRSKTSNLLSAVLCLIPELDWASLEVVELAIRRRMDEITSD